MDNEKKGLMTIDIKVRLASIKAQISKLQNELQKENDKMKVLQKKVESNLEDPKYKYSIECGIMDEHNILGGSDLKDGDEYIRIIATLTNNDVYENYVKMFGSIINRPNEKMRSVKYYTKYDMLFHEGGGYLILKDKVPCNKQDWENIKKGNIKKCLK